MKVELKLRAKYAKKKKEFFTTNWILLCNVLKKLFAGTSKRAISVVHINWIPVRILIFILNQFAK